MTHSHENNACRPEIQTARIVAQGYSSEGRSARSWACCLCKARGRAFEAAHDLAVDVRPQLGFHVAADPWCGGYLAQDMRLLRDRSEERDATRGFEVRHQQERVDHADDHLQWIGDPV